MIKNARTAFRESWLILLTWLIFCGWVLWSCARHYQTADGAKELVTVGGLPEWVFWGIAVPWLAASAFTIFFALRWIRPETEREESDV